MENLKLKDLVRKYKGKEYDYSCSESFLHAANDYYNLGLEEKAFKMVAPFSGGMYIEGICGIITAGLTVIGLLFTENVAHDSKYIKEISTKWINEFQEIKKSTVCKNLKEMYRDEVIGCTNLIIEGAEIFEHIIAEKLLEINK